MRYIALFCALPVFVAAEPVQGRVYVDENRNGVREFNETALAGVLVSDGVSVVSTDDKGAFFLQPDERSRVIFVIKPAGFESPRDKRQLPRFFRQLQPTSAETRGAEVFDFPLQRANEATPIRALVLADTQTGSMEDVGYLSRTISDPLAGASGCHFGVTLGDVVDDRGELFGAVSASLARIGIPWHNVKGNHDFSLADPEDAEGAFEREYGTSDYAFHYADTLFIALDNVRPTGGLRYTGGLTPKQFQFLEQLLAATPLERRVVVMTHIPWFLPAPGSPATYRAVDRERLFSLLKPFPRVLLLSGHTHAQRHVLHGAESGWNGSLPLHEYNVAAACGGFWGGPKDEAGIPVSTMWDGTPAGYAILTFEADRVRMDYRAARHPAEYQISMHAPVAARAGLGYVSYYANVFNGHDRWRVESRVSDRGYTPMRRVLAWDPSYAAAYLAQNRETMPATGRRLPDPVICHHLWRSSLPTDLPPGRHLIEVRATSPDGDTYRERREIEIVGP